VRASLFNPSDCLSTYMFPLPCSLQISSPLSRAKDVPLTFPVASLGWSLVPLYRFEIPLDTRNICFKDRHFLKIKRFLPSSARPRAYYIPMIFISPLLFPRVFKTLFLLFFNRSETRRTRPFTRGRCPRRTGFGISPSLSCPSFSNVNPPRTLLRIAPLARFLVLVSSLPPHSQSSP